MRQKLYTKRVEFDGIFCTGTLHLFEKQTIIKILKEIKRILKRNGKIVLDFATDIERLNQKKEKVIFDGEGNYQTEDFVKNV